MRSRRKKIRTKEKAQNTRVVKNKRVKGNEARVQGGRKNRRKSYYAD